MKRVVITGMGIYSCIGKNLDEVKDSLYKGKSGIGIDPVRKELGYFSALTGILERPELKKLLDRRKRLCLPEQGEYAYLATLEAFRNAGIDEAYLEANEVGILYGNDSSAAPVINAVDIIREKKNTALVGSGSIFQSMNSTVTMNLSVIFKLEESTSPLQVPVPVVHMQLAWVICSLNQDCKIVSYAVVRRKSIRTL